MPGHVTPSGIAEATHQASRRRHYPPINGLPDRRASWRKTQDMSTIGAIASKAFADHLATIAPDEWHRAATEQLLADLDARYPRDDMVVLARYELTWRRQALLVDVGIARPMSLPIAGYRDLPHAQVGHEPHRFTALPESATRTVRLVPEPTRPFFDAIVEAHRSREADFSAATRWPEAFARQHGRPPTWGEIEDAFPRIGAWLASKRGDA